MNSQEQRRRQYFTEFNRQAHFWFATDGKWVGGAAWEPGIRERMWAALSLLSGTKKDIELAQLILLTASDDQGDFNLTFGMLLLRIYEDVLSDEVSRMLMELGVSHIDHVSAHIMRYTENCGLFNAFGLSEAARRYDRPELLERARLRSETFADHMRHYTAGAEFNSVNYHAVTVNAAAIIRLFCHDSVMRDEAREIEHRFWRSLAQVWHPRLRSTAGASGRSYTSDSMSSLSTMRHVVWQVLGDAVCLSQMELFNPESDIPLKCHSMESTACEGAWLSSVSYEVPSDAVELFTIKNFPYSARQKAWIPGFREHKEVDEPSIDARAHGGWQPRGGSTKYVPSSSLHPSGESFLSVYMLPEFGVGTATRAMCGQSDVFHATWATGKTGASPLAGIRSIYPRYIMNNKLDEFLSTRQYPVNINDDGRGIAVQDHELSLLAYSANDLITAGITRMELAILLPVWFNDVDEIYVGDDKLKSDRLSMAEQCPVYIRDGEIYLAIKPLSGSNLGRKYAMELRRYPAFRTLSLINYEGAPRDFDPAFLRQCRTGAAFIIGAKADFGDFSAFRKEAADIKLSDAIYEPQRTVKASWRQRQIEFMSELQSEEIRYIKIAGEYQH
jgi:hypothetical protein